MAREVKLGASTPSHHESHRKAKIKFLKLTTMQEQVLPSTTMTSLEGRVPIALPHTYLLESVAGG